MITFYPRDIGLWRDHFDFAPDITLTPKTKTNHQRFSDRDDLIGFCKQHGVRLDDPENPFEILGPENHPTLGPDTYVVKQWTVLGWIRDDYTSALGHNTYNTETVRMNQRIQELAEQAGSTHKQNLGVYQFYTDELEKFAELIVLECADIALSERITDEEIDMSDDIEDRCYLRGNNGGIVDAVIAMKQHFGVKE